MASFDFANKFMFTANITGRVKNTTLPVSRALFSLFEAIVNSLHAISNSKRNDGEIIINVQREQLLDIDSSKVISKIISFEIIDNWIGLNDENIESFFKSDSRYKEQRGDKGIGRFTWLKAFSDVNIESYYVDKDGKNILGSFPFCLNNSSR